MTNKNRANRQAATAEKSILPSISRELLVDLKSRGIMALKQISRANQERVWEWSKALVRNYLRVLEADPSNIRDIESLPFPKEQIKLAIKLALPLYVSAGMQSMVRILKSAYKEIGAFQSIEPADREFVSSVSAGHGKAASIPDRHTQRSYDKYMEVAIAEKKALLHEINDFVTGLTALKHELK